MYIMTFKRYKMKSKKGDITWDTIVTLILAVVAVLVIGLIIYLNKDKLSDLIATVGRILRFKS